jgi:lysophospholipase L1-like esterase
LKDSATKIKSFKTPIFINIILIISSVLCTLLIGEIFARYRLSAWPFESAKREIPYLTEKDVNLRWRFSPEDGRNSLGLRNREIGKKGRDVFRILFLGDSLVWMGDTSSGKLYTQVAEENLNNVLKTDKRIEVINAGVPGYTTYQELEFLNVYGLDMEPDLVILGFVFNDVYYKYLHRPTQEQLLPLDPVVRLHRFDVDFFPGIVFARSYLAHETIYALQIIGQKLGLYPYYPFERHDDFYLAWKSYGWVESEGLINKMHQQLVDKNIPLMIVIFPISDQVDDKYLKINKDYVLYPQNRIKEISAKYNIPYLDLTETLYKSGGRELFADYLHLNKKGNDIVSAEIKQYLIDKLSFWFDR